MAVFSKDIQDRLKLVDIIQTTKASNDIALCLQRTQNKLAQTGDEIEAESIRAEAFKDIAKACGYTFN